MLDSVLPKYCASAIFITDLQGVDSLSLLNLGANKLESVPDLRTLPGLKELYLEGNQIKDATFPAGFANVKSLHTIVLSSNNILTLTNETFAVLTNSSLRRLDIARNGLRSVSGSSDRLRRVRRE